MILRSTKDSPNACKAKITGFLLPEKAPDVLVVFTKIGMCKMTSEGMTGEEILYSMLQGESIHVHMEVVS